jgi:TonB family protein
MSHASARVGTGKGLERRVYPRQSIQSLAYVELGEGNGGIVLNVSEGGMAVQAIMSLMNDELPRVRVKLSHSNKGIEAEGRIAWSSDLRKLVGVEFVDLPQQARSLIQEWISLEAPREFPEGGSLGPMEKTGATVATRTLGRMENPIPALPALGIGRARKNQNRAPFTESPPVRIASVPLAALSSGVPPVNTFHSERPQGASAPGESGPGIGKKWQWLLASLAVAALFAAGFFGLPGERALTSLATKSEPAVDSHLGLKLDWTGTDWRLSWDPNAPALLKATKGQLFVTDGTLQKTVDLDASDLHGGSIIYSPLTNDVVWKLQVVDADSSPEPVSESVRIVSGRSAPSSTPVESQTRLVPVRVVPAPNETLEYRSRFGPETKPNVKHSGGSLISSKAAAAPVATPGVPQPAPEPARTPAKDSPSNLTAGAITTTLPSVGARIQPESVPVIAAKRSDAESLGTILAPTRKGGFVQPAQLLSSSNPNYPPLAKQDGISGTVELRFKIGTNGTVHDISVVKGSAILAQAAAEAVGDRKYRPARVNGVPSETEASAIFDFKLN